MVKPGIYPAAVTPFQDGGGVDLPSVAKLLAWFEASGCQGAVLAGTNGEGPSLSAIEKRDLIRSAMPLRGKLDLILGIATPSLDEAIWLCKQASTAGAVAVLLMAPYYFREADEEGVQEWFETIIAKSPLPVLVYNFPQRTGFTMSPEFLRRLSNLEMMAGAKDSSGARDNIAAYRQALPGKSLFVGNETLLLEALREGWSGSISGAANVLPQWLSQIASEWGTDEESAEVKFGLLLPMLELIRKGPQPALNKALLAQAGIIGSDAVRLPLNRVEPRTSGDHSIFFTRRLGCSAFQQFGLGASRA